MISVVVIVSAVGDGCLCKNRKPAPIQFFVRPQSIRPRDRLFIDCTELVIQSLTEGFIIFARPDFFTPVFLVLELFKDGVGSRNVVHGKVPCRERGNGRIHLLKLGVKMRTAHLEEAPLILWNIDLREIIHRLTVGTASDHRATRLGAREAIQSDEKVKSHCVRF